MVPIISLQDRTDLKDLEKNIGEKPKDDTEIKEQSWDLRSRSLTTPLDQIISASPILLM